MNVNGIRQYKQLYILKQNIALNKATKITYYRYTNIIFTILIVVSLHTGSENNSLYLYYKGLSKTLLTFKFDTVKSVLDKDKKEDDTNEFVSAVCWRALPDGVSLFLYVHLYHWAYTKCLVDLYF